MRPRKPDSYLICRALSKPNHATDVCAIQYVVASDSNPINTRPAGKADMHSAIIYLQPLPVKFRFGVCSQNPDSMTRSSPHLNKLLKFRTKPRRCFRFEM